MKNNHTPGPWNAHRNIGRKSEVGIVAAAAPCIIAIMGNQKEWPEEAEANARLIAAAPDLLAALENIVQNFDMGDFIITVAAQGEDTPEHRANLDFARAAIAKATDPQ